MTNIVIGYEGPADRLGACVGGLLTGQGMGLGTWLQSKASGRKALGPVLVVALLLGALAAGPVGASDRSGRSEAPAFLSGVVTGKVRSGFRINARTSAFHSRATLTDEEGEDVDRNQLVRGVQVKFHLRRGKIDQIIVFLPR